LTATERARRARGIRVLAGIEGIAAAPASGRDSLRFLDDRRRRGNLRLVITGLDLWLPQRRIRLHGRRRRDVGQDDRGLATGGNLRAALQHPQAIFELPVAILQLFILAGELAQLILKLLNAHLRIGIIGLRASMLLCPTAEPGWVWTSAMTARP